MSARMLVGRSPRSVSSSSTVARVGLPIPNAKNLERISACTFFTAQTDTLFTTQ